MSTGFVGAENANIKIGDTVVGDRARPDWPVRHRWCRAARRHHHHRRGRRRRAPGRGRSSSGADVTLNFRNVDVVDEVMKLTGGRGADSAIEALGLQSTFEQAMRCIKPGGTLSSLGVCSITDLKIPLGPFASGLGDHTIQTALCPGGKERMRA